MRRILSFLFGLLALAALGWDLWRGPFAGQPVAFTSTADYWSAIHRSSLIGLNAFVEKSLSPGLWDIVLLPLLVSPAFIPAAALALFFFLIRRRRRPVAQRGLMFPRKRK